MSSIPIPRYFVFTLEDSTWVVQRGPDQVQELLTGKERSHSSLDDSFAITDIELEILVAQGIVERFDDAYVWLRDTQHTEGMISMTALARPLGVATYYYVEIDAPPERHDAIKDAIEKLGLSDRYRVTQRFRKMVIMTASEEPFTKLGAAEDAQFLLAPALHKFDASASVKLVRFHSDDIPPPATPPDTESRNLIKTSAEETKGHTIVCVDDEEITHEIAREVMQAWGVEVFSAYTGRDAITLIEDVDPALILMDLQLPDMHGYEIVAHILNNPDLAHIPIIIISALTSETDRMLAFNIAHAADYATKPITGEEIRRKVWRILN